MLHEITISTSVVHEEFHVPQAYEDSFESTSLHVLYACRRLEAQRQLLLGARISFAARPLRFETIR
jgi:hypothetical protein